MTAKKRPAKPRSAWRPPPGLRIEVAVTRGDVFFKSESTPAEALNVARLLVALARQLAKEAPDVLPVADSVPGAYLDIPDDEVYDAHQQRPRVGFRLADR